MINNFFESRIAARQSPKEIVTVCQSVILNILNRDVHTLYNEIIVFYCMLYCYILSASHDQVSCL